jgi:formiminotetrahydrofolate cyclodeaminase
MVANLTVGTQEYQDVSDELSQLAERAQAVKGDLVHAVDEDTQAFSRLLDAMRLPRATPDDQRLRDAAIQEATRNAAEVPLQTARLSMRALELASRVAVIGQRQAVSDAGVAALMARAAVEGAVLNVLINIRSIHDEDFTRACRAETEHLTADARSMCEDVVSRVYDQVS